MIGNHLQIRRKKTIQLYIINTIIVSMSTAISYFLDDRQMNLFLVAIMCLSPIVLLWYPKFYKSDVLCIVLLLSMIFFARLYPDSFRWSTIIYTALFLMTFMAYTRLLKTNALKLVDYLILLKYLIYAYAIMLLLQQLLVLVNLEPINVAFRFPENKWKLPSLAPEPSHAARLVGLFMFSFIQIKTLILKRTYNFKIDFKSDKYVWLSYAWLTLTMGSATAYLFMILVIIQLLNFKNSIPLLIGTLLLVTYLNVSNNVAAERSYKIFLATITLNEDKIIEADHSGSIRIVPVIMAIKSLNLFEKETWIGNGIDHVAEKFHMKFPGVPEGASGGGMFEFIINFGLINFLIFFMLTVNVIQLYDINNLIVWILLVLIGTINSQIVWSAMILLTTNTSFKSKYKHKKYKFNS